VHRKLSALSLAPLLLALGGCGPAGPGVDAGADVPPERCDLDTACPEEAPLAGGPCAGALSCEYNMCGGGPFTDTYACEGGQWTFVSSMCLGAPPVLAELCRTPQTTGVEGARIVITPDAAGAPAYTDGQRVELVIGPQGGAMIPYRVRVEGLDATPTCIRATASVTSDGMTAMDTKQLRLRCGSTLRVYEILPLCPAPGDHELTLEVTVEGIGTESVTLVGTNSMGCPRGG
jgi:hypothetical protein